MAKEARTIELPKTPEVFEYDADGNLVADGRWSYAYDCENRLIAVEPSAASVAAGTRRERVQFEYDGLSRRIRRTVSFWGGQSWALVSDIRYLYDGWTERGSAEKAFRASGMARRAEPSGCPLGRRVSNPIAEYIPSEGGMRAIRSYVWGLDLSESAQGAGGVGGLLATRVHAVRSWTEEIEGVTETRTSTLTGEEFMLADLPVISFEEATALELSFPAYDGNGNILAHLSPATGTPLATQTYGPFGETLTRTGWDERFLPHRFSTKPEERFGGLNYYGYRFYSAELGRWVNRDPIGEWGGVNLYGIVRNDLVSAVDFLGLDCILVTDRNVRLLFGTSPFYHYALEYWKGCCPAKRQEVSIDKQTGVTPTDKVELLNTPGHKAWHWIPAQPIPSSSPGGPSIEIPGYWKYDDVGISVINYGFPTGNHRSKSAANIFDDSDGNVQSKWIDILASAKAYGFAEQQGFTTFIHFPYSAYPSVVGTNSNTFVREMVAQAGLTMFELGGSHPGPNRADPSELRFKHLANPDQPHNKPANAP